MPDPLLKVFRRIDLCFERGEGSWLYTEDGEAYLDFASGIAVNSLGHNHPHLVAAVKAQLDKLWHTSNLVRIPDGERLATRLTDACFADVAFFANSGGEANEAAVKMARRYHSAKGSPERYRIVTFAGAFHGRSLAMIAATGYAPYLEGFGPRVDGFDQVPLGDWDALEAAITPQTAAILLEPIQGEGGLHCLAPETLQRLRALCDEHGILLIFDEVQSGVGRTGKFFAYEWSSIEPDIATLAKGIGGGFPMGVCLATREAASGMTAGAHGTTFGGNPLAMSAGNAVLDIVLDQAFLDRVLETAQLLHDGLHRIAHDYPDIVAEVRGTGLLQGLQLHGETAPLVELLRIHRLLAVPARENVVRFAPPLTVLPEEIGDAIRRIEMTADLCRESQREKPGAQPISTNAALSVDPCALPANAGARL
ncbi:aspartate aminotransferase family protein [Aurantiacibacter xanthus]|uniref:Aspartate aminotransferase family protein n=1 Tax=Aurantiacibacter xanthus TaxID=1784712 RepID=A0A3A1P3F6_9SPHN|nr:aspartate aminotransferase family protein [Aurantiacibacter xanthus]RIV85478.1 aspartate aminotransferase family protein [Aurantiacibacter xanthus]